MNRLQVITTLLGTLFLGTVFAEDFSRSTPISGDSITGDYAEARTCDVWTGPCFTNGELNVRGDHALMVWSIQRGLWQGTRLDGLKIVAAIDSEGTLGTVTEGKVRAVLYVDSKAASGQRDALVAMAKKLAGKYLKNVVRVHRRAITFTRQGQVVNLKVAGVRSRGARGGAADVRLKTRALSYHRDAHCGNEEKAFPPLAKTTTSACVKTLLNSCKKSGLGLSWSDPDTRSAMVGRFKIEMISI